MQMLRRLSPVRVIGMTRARTHSEDPPMIAQIVRNHQDAARSQSANVLEPLNPTSALLPCQHQNAKLETSAPFNNCQVLDLGSS
jgi:hypothetical protein